MNQLQKKQIINLCVRWLAIYILIAAVFFLYQKQLSDSYEREVLSWIGRVQEGSDMQTAIFQSPDETSYLNGIKFLQNAGYKESGTSYLRKNIAGYGRITFLAGALFICAVGAVCDLYKNKRQAKELALLLEKERDSVYTQIQSEKEFVENERKKMGTYMENLSHQLKTPITGIMLHLEYLLDTENAPSKRERLDACIRQLSHISDITIVLLRLAQLDSGKIWMKRKRENLTRLMESCMERISFLSKEKNIEIHKKLTNDCILSCDGFWIKEAIWNVLKNAVELTPQDGIIRVTLTPKDHFYDIRIFNSGTKLEPKYHELIFERFYQIDSKKSGGFGIGLHLAREIAILHQGSLRVLDTGEDGTTFQFFLPKLIAKDHSNLTDL